VSDLQVQIEEGIATASFNRPSRKNAFTAEMLAQLHTFVTDIHDDDTVRALILTGSDGSFCAGADLNELGNAKSAPIDHKEHLTHGVHKVALAIADFDGPVIASIEGPAIGAGMDFALMADIRIGSTTTRFSEGYIRVGLVPGNGGCFFLPRIIGVAKALELLWTGRMVEADEALDLGLLSTLTPPGGAYKAAYELAQQIAALPPVAIRMIKRTTYQSLSTDLRTSLNMVASDMGIVRSMSDSREAFEAFREGRPGRYSGR
jgi:enoyl-CoA hydratase/carnithine racemase